MIAFSGIDDGVEQDQENKKGDLEAASNGFNPTKMPSGEEVN